MGMGDPSSPRSATVSTASTPGARRAAAVAARGGRGGRPPRRRGVEAGEARMGGRAADDHGVTVRGIHDVGDVAAAAGDEPAILAAAHGRAHEALAGRWRDGWVCRVIVHAYN